MPRGNKARVLWNQDIDVYNPEVIPVSIAREILRHLPVPDLLIFSQVLKNTYRAAQDPQLWTSKLTAMGLWSTAQPPQLKHIPLKPLDNPLTGVDHVVRAPKAAKAQVIRLYRALLPYYYDLMTTQAYENLKLLRQFDTPEDQARILNNLLMINKIDTEPLASVVRDKLLSLIEIFESALLREVEIHFDVEDWKSARRFVTVLLSLQNQHTLIDFFLQKVDAAGLMSLTDQFLCEKYFDDEGRPVEEEFQRLLKTVIDVFNHQAEVVDAMFPKEVPIMAKVCEEIIANQLNLIVLSLVAYSKKYPQRYVETIPYIYQLFTSKFVEQLIPLENIGSSYKELVIELMDMMFELVVSEYVRDEISRVREQCSDNINQWIKEVSMREQETQQQILKHVKVETKNAFLSSFKKMFVPTSKLGEVDAEPAEQYLEIEAKAKILSANIQLLTLILLPELVLTTLNYGKEGLHRLAVFRNYLMAGLRLDILATMQEMFVDIIETIGTNHLRPGFDRAMRYLQTYNPNLATYTLDHHETFDQPLVLFFELINMADLIIQMIDIFYKEEFINNNLVKHENSVLNPALQHKKGLEAIVDHYVADGLNVALEILVDKIEEVYRTQLRPEDYDPPALAALGHTAAGYQAVQVLEENMDLLVDLADRLIVDVFQQEIAERFFQVLVKILKKSTILVQGATNLISDLNMYCDFIRSHIRTNKRLVLPLFESLKKVGNIYLISGDDSKAIAKLVSDLSKFNGIFSQEEIYEFVQRRKDWTQVKRHVEKVMYGFGFGDCVII